MITRKNYVAIADILSKYDLPNTLIKELAEYFKSDNSKFQTSKFIYYYQDKKFKFKRDNGNLSKFGKEAMKEFIEQKEKEKEYNEASIVHKEYKKTINQTIF